MGDPKGERKQASLKRSGLTEAEASKEDRNEIHAQTAHGSPLLEIRNWKLV